MSKIEIPLKEYQGMKTKIANLENALNSISKEASTYKEKHETIRSLVLDLEKERFINRLFSWKSIIAPFKELFEDDKLSES